MDKDLKRLLIKISIMLLPGIVLFLPVYTLLYYSRELMPVKEIIEIHDKKNLVGLSYSDPAVNFKYSMFIKKRPSICVLGTSRTMQFREKYFNRPFYNCGGGISRLGDLRKFIEKAQIEDLKLLIIGLDQNFFNKKWDDMKDNPSYSYFLLHDRNISKIPLLQYTKVINDFIAGKCTIGSVIKRRSNIGLNAIVNQNGFASDGSYHYGKDISDKKDTSLEIDAALRSFGSGESYRFEFGAKVNNDALGELEKLLDDCKKYNYHVVAYLPPYPGRVNDKFFEYRRKYAYLFNLKNEISPIFAKYGQEFYDYSDVRRLGASDREFFDALHGSEKVSLRILLDMMDKGSVIGSFCDRAYLNALLRNSKEDLFIFDESY